MYEPGYGVRLLRSFAKNWHRILDVLESVANFEHHENETLRETAEECQLLIADLHAGISDPVPTPEAYQRACEALSRKTDALRKIKNMAESDHASLWDACSIADKALHNQKPFQTSGERDDG